MIIEVVVALVASVASVAGFHFMTRHHILRAMEQQGIHLKCGLCGLIVARFKQAEDGVIKCANCLRKEEKEAKARW